MNKKAYIFDLDGVLVFTDQFHYRAWKKIADRLGIPFDEKINNSLRGVSRRESLELILQKSTRSFSENEKEALMEEKNHDYQMLLSDMSPIDVSNEVRATLKELKRAGYRLGIGSSSKNTKYILEKVQLISMFDAVSDGTNITKSKPDPEVFIKAAQFLGEQPENCVVVEDAYAGIDAAKSAGMSAIGIGDAAGYAKSDYSITNFSELPFL